jgi:hypothetical protein
MSINVNQLIVIEGALRDGDLHPAGSQTAPWGTGVTHKQLKMETEAMDGSPCKRLKAVPGNDDYEQQAAGVAITSGLSMQLCDGAVPDETICEMISQGAEGKVYRSQFMSRTVIIKERVSKGYRVPELDKKLNKQRILQESRCMARCRKAGVATPTLFLVDQAKYLLVMEEIEGRTLKVILREHAASGSIPNYFLLSGCCYLPLHP